MKILLANSPCRIKLKSNQERYFVRAGSRWPFSVVKKRNQRLSYLPFPFFLAYTAALLEKEGLAVEAWDGVALNQTEEEFLESLKKIKPNVILLETATATINHDYQMVRKIKKQLKEVIVCLTGPQVTVFPRQTFKDCPEVDLVIQGEYEVAFRDYCLALKKGQSFDRIAGLVFKKNRRLVVNPPRLTEDINVLPYPARHLFPNREISDPTVYWDGFCQFKPAIQMLATRGCPFRCNFCLWNQVIYQNGPYRMFKAKRVVDEMIFCQKKYGAKEIYFDDDTFTANKKNVLAICREIRKRRLKIHWSVMGDAMVTDQEMIEAMSQAGCVGIKFGVESGDRKILRSIQKPIDFAKLEKFTDWCAKRRLKTHATFTFGLSGETQTTMEKTLKLAERLDVDSVQFSITTPFPGTRYYQELKKKRRLKVKSWEDFDGACQSVVKFENLSRREVVAYCRAATGRWLLTKLRQPHWLLRQFFYLRRLIKGQGLTVIWKLSKKMVTLLTARS